MTSMVELIEEANGKFDELLVSRHEEGAEKYGAFKFLESNTLEEAMFELVDLSNYARYTFIKLYLLNEHLDKTVGGEPVEIGVASFTSARPEMDKPEESE